MKKILILSILTLCFLYVKASHIIGGDIKVQWISQNQYTVQVKVFRDCGPSSISMPSSVTLGLYEIGTNTQVSTYVLTNPTINTSIPLGDACYTPTSICVDEGIFTSNTINIPDFGPGYYLSTQIFSRSNNVTNLLNSGSEGMTFYAEIPDPSLGQNSSPDFGPYPADAYLCVTGVKNFNLNVVDADGDSLVYSLVEPLTSTGNGTNAGTGAYPYYSPVTWQAGYSLANICGGVPAMSINSVTGEISAAPAAIGVYVFAVRVEEYRNGVKIGESRRDVQYAALACALDSPPSIDLEDSVDVYVSDIFCVDVLSSDGNGADTIYTELFSADINLQANYVAPDTLNGMLYYLDFKQNDTLWIPHLDSVNNALEGIGIVPSRFCWSPTCNDLDSVYNVNIISYSLGCAGSDTVTSDVVFQVVNNPAPLINFNDGQDSINVQVLNDTCINILVQSPVNNDTLVVITSSTGIDLQGNYIYPDTLNGDFYYTGFNNGGTIWTDTLIYDSLNNTFYSFGTTPIRYCWTPDCHEIDSVFNINIQAFTLSCSASDTAELDFIINTIYDPSPVTNIINDTVTFNALSTSCIDLMVLDSLTNDSLLVSLMYNNDTATMVTPEILDGEYFYTDFLGEDTMWIPHFQYNLDSVNYLGVDTVPVRFCITPSCNDVDSIYDFSVYSETTGCGAANTSEANIAIRIIHEKDPYLRVDTPDTIITSLGQGACIDILMGDSISSDLLVLNISSQIIDFSTNLVQPQVLNNENFYTNFMGEDTLWFEDYVIANDSVYGYNKVALRYCWEPTCEFIDSVFDINTTLESRGCGAPYFYYDSIKMIVTAPPINLTISNPNVVFHPFNQETCFDVIARDNLNYNNTISLDPQESIYYDFQENYISPENLNGESYYTNFLGNDTLWINNYSINGTTVKGTNYSAARYCLVSDCDNLVVSEFNLDFKMSMELCGTRISNSNVHIELDPPVGNVAPIPNVFTPNGTDGNDYFKLEGNSDPCYDVMNVEIFNRWGKKVFESTNPLFKWDGKHHKTGIDCAAGAYYVIIDGTYGSQYDVFGNRIPNVVRDQFTLYLMR